MPGKYCCVCGNSHSKDPHVSFHRFPSDEIKRNRWLQAFDMEEVDVKSHMRVCSRHFPDGNTDNPPNLIIGKRFSSPVKKQHPRAKRVKLREKSREIRKLSASRSSSESRTPTPADQEWVAHESTPTGDQLEAEHTVHELTECAATSTRTDVLIDRALLARIEFLEAENERLEKEAQKVNSQHFRIEQIKQDDNLVRFYTGFISFSLFRHFFEFLGEVVEHLNYWGGGGGGMGDRRA